MRLLIDFIYFFHVLLCCFRRVRKIGESDYQLRHVCLPVRPSIRLSAWNNSAPIEKIFLKFYIRAFFEKLSIRL